MFVTKIVKIGQLVENETYRELGDFISLFFSFGMESRLITKEGILLRVRTLLREERLLKACD
jgi:hypothetical protein